MTAESPPAGPFAGLRIVEIAHSVAGPYCTKLLADFGADVVKVEPPSGDTSRALGASPETSPLFLYCNTSKRSVVADLETEEGRELVARLLARADAVVTDRTPEDLGLTDLAQAHLGDPHALDHLLVTCITPYGLTGPRSQVPGGELTLGHGGGLFSMLPIRCRDTERAPVMLGGYQVSYQGALVAALATASILLQRRHDAPAGGLVDVSLQDVMVSLMAPMVAGVRYHESSWCRVPDRPPAMGRLQTKGGGYIILNAFDDHHFALFRELMGNPDWCAGDEWLDMTYRVHHLFEFATRVDEWALTQDRDDLYHRAAGVGIPCGPIYSADDVMSYAQYEARDYFVEVDHPGTGVLRYPGWPYRMGASRPTIGRHAPRLGEHEEEVRTELDKEGATRGSGGDRNRREPTAEDERDPAGRDGGANRSTLPLDGIRVLELTWVWAGPYAGVLLSMLGAEVIKVEGPKRLDLTRRSVLWPRHEEQPFSIGPEEGMAYNTMNLGKRSVTLDLTQEEGRELARRLAASCDVVYDNMRPGALGKLGLGPEDLLALKPELVVASSSGRGHGGPESEYLGYAMVHQAVGGGAYISGYPDDHPTHSGGDVDLLNAITLAFSVVAALHHRKQTGEGQFIDYSQCEGVTSLIGEVLLDAQLTGNVAERMGNAHPRVAPHSVYRTWGVDRWIALEVHTDDDFRTLCEVMEQPSLAEDPRFATNAARKEHEAALDQTIEAWTRERDRDFLARTLNGAGLVAAPVRDAKDLYADSHLRERGSFATVEHPQLGELVLPGAPFQLRGHDLTPRHAPLLGEHNDLVLGALGVSAAELEDLRSRGVIT